MSAFYIPTYDPDTGKYDIKTYDQAPCHYALQECTEAPLRLAVIDWVAMYKHQIDSDKWPVYRKFVHWVLNDGPLADVFLTKTVSAATQGGVVLDADKHRDLVAMAAIMLRTGREYHSNLGVYAHVLKLGYSHEVAWLLFSCIQKAAGKGQYTSRHVGGHHVLNSNMSDIAVFRFLAGWPIQPEDGDSFKENGGQYFIEKNINNLFKGGAQPTLHDYINRFCDRQKDPQGWGYISRINERSLWNLADSIHENIQKAKQEYKEAA